MKVDRKIYKGIEYVLFQDLPLPQQERFMESMGADYFIKIMIDGKITARCIQYKDYSAWFENQFKAEVVTSSRDSVHVSNIDLAKSLTLKSA